MSHSLHRILYKLCKFCDLIINMCIWNFDVMQNNVKNSLKLV